MTSRISRLLILFLVAALTIYVVLMNRETAVIRLTPGFQMTAMAGVIYLIIFAAGITCATLAGIFFGIRS